MDLPDITHAEVIRRLQTELEQLGSAAALARHYDVSARLMQSIMRGERNVCPKLLKKLGLRRVTLIVHRYEPIASQVDRWAVTVRKKALKGERIAVE